MKKSGFKLVYLSVKPRHDFKNRALNRVFPNPYNRYNMEAIADRAVSKIVDNNSSVVAINQVNLLPVARILKKQINEEICVISLSHGNESGDLLHEMLRESGGWLSRSAAALQIGRVMLQEAKLLTNFVDLMLCMSEIEEKINAWLGAKRSMVVHRTFKPEFLDWSPVEGRVGFVGTSRPSSKQRRDCPSPQGSRRPQNRCFRLGGAHCWRP